MSTFKLHISTDNAAFADDSRNHEVARILRRTAERLELNDGIGQIALYEKLALMDANGNSVGNAEFEGDDND